MKPRKRLKLVLQLWQDYQTILSRISVTMEKFENVDYNELGFDPHVYGLLIDWRWLSGLLISLDHIEVRGYLRANKGA
ncbi:hypothetical protein Syun_019614 [Stephania yunnanensis]|uniref:Uncharacterized protein n=1 Tax=Stephania yunnanensis TaxID=152371 RepID=A0AAP0IWF6_9MAGN